MPFYDYDYGYYGYPRFNICRLLNIVQGDRIVVRSAGNINGTGTFIRTQGHHIVWIDQANNMRVTDLATIDVAKLTCCCPGDVAPGFVD